MIAAAGQGGHIQRPAAFQSQFIMQESAAVGGNDQEHFDGRRAGGGRTARLQDAPGIHGPRGPGDADDDPPRFGHTHPPPSAGGRS